MDIVFRDQYLTSAIAEVIDDARDWLSFYYATPCFARFVRGTPSEQKKFFSKFTTWKRDFDSDGEYFSRLVWTARWKFYRELRMRMLAETNRKRKRELANECDMCMSDAKLYVPVMWGNANESLILLEDYSDLTRQYFLDKNDKRTRLQFVFYERNHCGDFDPYWYEMAHKQVVFLENKWDAIDDRRFVETWFKHGRKKLN